MSFTDEEKEVMKSLVEKALEDLKKAEEVKTGESIEYVAGEKKYEDVLKKLKEKLS